MPRRDTDRDLPRVTVAMATFNGLPWLGQQVRSILTQRGVEVTLVISDDGSTDGTLEWLKRLSQLDSRVRVLPARTGPAGVGPNFLYLVQEISPPPGGYVAFSDQDDLWHPNKLAHQVEFLRTRGADATSSNVMTFTQRGTREVLVKSQPQKKWDFVFEAPGPGSTFVLTERAFEMLRQGLAPVDPQRVWLHDWLIYALVRAAGLRWVIDPRPHVAYRQHEKNLLGAHRGRDAAKFRWENLRNGRYRDQFELVAQAARELGAQTGRDRAWLDDLDGLLDQLRKPTGRPRLGLLRFVPQMRRRRVEAAALGALGTVGLW